MRTPRHYCFRGWSRWEGLAISTATLPRHEARSRVLALFEPGDRVHTVGPMLVLCFGRPRRMQAETAPGAVLQRAGSRLCTAPFDEGAVGHGPDELWWVEGDSVHRAVLDGSTAVQPGEWLDVSSLRRPAMDGLIPPPVPLAGPTVAASADELLADGKPSFAAGRDAAAQAIRDALNGGDGGRKAARGWGEGQEPAPTLFDKVARMLSNVAWRTGPLAHALGARQARYLKRLAGMFDNGRIEDALKHAIPLGALGEPEKRPSLGVPSPRSELRISRIPVATTSNTQVPDDFMEQLRQYYRDAATRLEAEGNIQRAAFVLFELLRDDQAGIALLERHEKFALAAELAEGREMEPALVVRLWFRAKKVSRAIDVARRTGCFAVAVAQLERRDPVLGEKLRLAWADHAALQGDFLTAIDAVWPIESARDLAQGWIERALPVAGPHTRAALFVRRLQLDPGAGQAVAEAIHDELVDSDRIATQFRIALADELMKRKKACDHPVVSRPLARRLLFDLDGDYKKEARRSLRQLLSSDVDPVLRADLPHLPEHESVHVVHRTEPIAHEVPPRDAGTTECQALLALADGGALVGLGESGTIQLGPRGNTRRAFDLPADSLVLSTTGTLALTLKARGEITQLGRIDLGRGRARWWADLEFSVAAERMTNGMLFIADEDAISAIDVQGDQPRVLWRVPTPDGEQARALHVTPTNLYALVSHPEWVELWTFDLPSLTLRQRYDVTFALQAFQAINGPAQVSARVGGSRLMLGFAAADVEACKMSVYDLMTSNSRAPLFEIPGPVHPVAATDRALIYTEPGVSGRVLTYINKHDRAGKLYVRCPGVSSISADIAFDHIWASDDLGRVWSVDLRSGALMGPHPVGNLTSTRETAWGSKNP